MVAVPASCVVMGDVPGPPPFRHADVTIDEESGVEVDGR